MSYSRALAVINQAIELIAEFRYDDTGLLFDPYEVISVQVLNEDQTVVLETITSITKIAVGIYKVVTSPSYNTTSRLLFDKWAYRKTAGGTIEYGLLSTLVRASATVTDLNLINKLRVMLKDSHPDTNKRRYTDLELELYLEQGLWDINLCPPMFTAYTLTDWQTNVPTWESLILQSGMIFAMISEGVFQIGIEFNYNDMGISFSTDKSGKYQNLASMLLQNYTDKKEKMKKQFWFQNGCQPRATLTPSIAYSIRMMSSRQVRIR